MANSTRSNTKINSYNTGEIFAVIPVVNGKACGVVKRFYKTGELMGTAEHKDDYVDGKIIMYYKNKNIMREMLYVRGIGVSGICKEYYESSKLKRVTYWKNNKLHGSDTSYHESTCNKKREVNWINGSKEGPAKQFFENGDVFKTAVYKKNNVDGQTCTYYDTGELHYTKTYRNGITSGLSNTYWKNKNLKYQVSFVNNKLHGPAVKYNELGEPIAFTTWNNGVNIRKHSYSTIESQTKRTRESSTSTDDAPSSKRSKRKHRI